MKIEIFRELCHGVCMAFDVAAPPIPQDENGTASVSMQLGGIAITIAYQPDKSPDMALALVELGVAPAQVELAAWLSLMDANYLMQGDGTIAFGCNPSGDEAILQCLYPLTEVTSPGLADSLVQLTELARRWRKDHFLDGLRNGDEMADDGLTPATLGSSAFA